MEQSLLTVENLRFNSAFKYVADMNLNAILKMCKEERFPANTQIFQENTRGERLYFCAGRKDQDLKSDECTAPNGTGLSDQRGFLRRNGTAR